jgi:hypothetical protein
LQKGRLNGTKVSVSYSACKLSSTELVNIFDGLLNPAGALTITISTNWGIGSLISKTLCGTTVGSKTIIQTNTTSLSIGMLVSGTGINSAVSVTFTDAGDLVNRTAHGLIDGNIVAFPTLVTTTGIVVRTPYYVINSTADSFQVSSTLGGVALPLTNNGTGTMNYSCYITSINPNVSYDIDKAASATGTITTTNRTLDTTIATLKGWTISG